MRGAAAVRDYDAIVVGSGMGGLAAAAILARLRRRRVLVLERHWRAGGFTHTFARPGGFRWDVGLHYVGEVERGPVADVLRVATGGALAWTRVPEPYDRVVFPGLEFGFRSGRERLEEDLAHAFPAERAAIRAWLRDVRRAASWSVLLALRGAAPALVSRAAEAILASRGRLAARTTRSYLEARFRDPRLRAIVGARWGDHGLPPAQGPFFGHAMIAAHYLGGAWYPVGSAARIAEAAGEVVREAGGEVRVRAEVERIVVERGRAVGVRLASGEEIRAPVVISDAGARATFLRLVPEDVPIPFRETLRRIPTSVSTVSLYLGLSASPASLGVRGENFWLHDGLDHDALWARRADVLAGRPPIAYVSFPSLKDPEARAHTAEVIAGVDPSGFAAWEGTAWKRRGAEYEALKARVGDGLLAAAERRIPGLSALVVHRELSTPLTTQAFTGHPAGENYGVPLSPERLGMRWLSARTPVPGLFLTGADALVLGIAGAAGGGLACAAAVEGPGILREVAAESRRLAARAHAAATPGAPASAT